MKFTFKEWQAIKHNIEVAKREYLEQMENSKFSEDPLSLYQIFKRQAEEAQNFIDRIENATL